MAIASAQITLHYVVDIQAAYRYYLLQSSTLTAPSKPTTFPPSSEWDDTEPSYTEESTNSLYFVDCTVFCDDTFQYSEVSLSSSYEAAKEAYNKAKNAQSTADNAQSSVINVESRVAVNETNITSIAGMIANLVVDSNGATLMTQTENGWTFNIGNISDSLDAASGNIADLLSDTSNMENLIDSLEKTLTDHGVTLEYINIGTYNDQPCIELGEDDSDFKLRITNTSIQFLQGSDIPAYISNRALNIKKAVIENELQIGGFVWMKRDNENMGLTWTGETS